MRARIRWKTKQEGGRSEPLVECERPHYYPNVHFLDSNAPVPPTNGWSLSVAKIAELGDEYNWIAEVSYRRPEGPRHELRLHREFELYEGNKCVASGIFIGDADEGG